MAAVAPVTKAFSFSAGETQYTVGDRKKLLLISGPDVLEDEGLLREVAQEMSRKTREYPVNWVLKCSFDKANRQKASSFRGLGFEKGLKIFEKIRGEFGCALLTDVHETYQVEPISRVVDIIQIPALLLRQTDLVVAAAETGKPLHLKKGQQMAPWDVIPIAEKAKKAGNEKILICDRGTAFGYNRLVTDFTGITYVREQGYPMVVDISHTLQLHGTTNFDNEPRQKYMPSLARAAVAAGADGIFFETHPRPDQALCDGPISFPLREVDSLLKSLTGIWQLLDS